MKNFVIFFIVVFVVFQFCVSAEEKELGFWEKVSEIPENQKRIKRCYCGGYGSYGYGGGYPSYGGGYGGYPYMGGFGGGMPYGFGSPFGGFYG